MSTTNRNFSDLPVSETRRGKERRIGVEIEFGGLTLEETADVLGRALGGTVTNKNGKWRITDTSIGEVTFYLDTRFRQDISALQSEWIDAAARSVIPVEIITKPLSHSELNELSALETLLRAEGALGSRRSLFLGVGVHFNVEVRSLDLDDILPVLRAYAMVERALRRADPVDITRDITTFVDPYPKALARHLALAPPGSMDELISLYLTHAPSRDHGLDMLCIFAEIAPERVARAVNDSAVSARPTFHFRLPECRIDEADWSLVQEWQRWVAIETIAESDGLLRELAELWAEDRSERSRDEAIYERIRPLIQRRESA
ncbi:amidoligase family protein [Thalassococcus sp. S3]|uniref:amidoligase family protein n=1 Tax=Thalassococcus sp. S3 TaxID=2017482 RepID=UPI00102436BD|nr:amidoligase family protein [Thalassococcus sp. S3]QBF29952.1 hypothetical protein CFI11_01785 [Thalassococcus sp. S3]